MSIYSKLATKIVDFGCKKSNPRKSNQYNPTGEVKKITIHHMAGKCDAESCAKRHLTNDKEQSANYYIGNDGEIVGGVSEDRRAWTSGSRINDYLAITIEVSNDINKEPWTVSDKALQATIDLCIDIAERHKIKPIKFTGDKEGNLTMHCYFQKTACPGTYLKSKFEDIARAINEGTHSSIPEIPTLEKPKIPNYYLRNGSRGEEAKKLQYALNYLHYTGLNGKVLNVDGIIGQQTVYALRKFQRDKGLVVDGVYGPKTKDKLERAIQ